MRGDVFTPQDADSKTKAAQKEAFRELFVCSGHRVVERARASLRLCVRVPRGASSARRGRCLS